MPPAPVLQYFPSQTLLKESLERAQEETERIKWAMQELEEQTCSIKVMPRPPQCQANRWEHTGLMFFFHPGVL